ncbi:MAG: methylenetetrahydrofolate reductase [NAD(P)H] [Planctomycetota bacterium]|nr:methylenetetrahydrofolate reductase [NAD(P)H] [Planctomycetota bacterium]MDA1140621.1 methylenetetrahydrofolate reductase [NAD(P)H] [Planctomycetota bacterium]
MSIHLIRDIYTAHKQIQGPVISFEYFPFKTEEGQASFFDKTLPRLLDLGPDFCSVTYGAGGSTRDKSIKIVDRIQREFGLTTMLHLTCVSATQDEIGGVLSEASELGIRNILALRGDPPQGTKVWVKPEGGFEYSYELVTYIAKSGGFSIGTAGFPEGHIDCKEGKLVDWGHLKNKIDCGADFVITQLFFDNADYFEMREHLRSQGVTVPLVAGVLPILSGSQIKRFTQMCGARLPETLLTKLEEIGDDDEAAAEFGIKYATEQCEELITRGVEGIHFYTLNKSRSTIAIMENLGLA